MHKHTHSVPSGKPANKSSSRIAFSLACDFNAATKLNVDPLMASRRWPMRRILYSWTYQHTLVRKGKRMERTHRHMHAHVERASETNPSSNQQHEHVLVGRGRGEETLSAAIGPPPGCVANPFEDRRSRMTLSKAPASSCRSAAPAEGAAPSVSISRTRNCSRSEIIPFCGCPLTDCTPKLQIVPHITDCTP